MDQVDIVEMIGDRLTQIDIAIARLVPSDPKAAELTALRLNLDAQQRQLVKLVFDANSARFQEAASDLASVNDSIADDLQRIDGIASAIDGVNRFLSSVTSLVSTASKLV